MAAVRDGDEKEFRKIFDVYYLQLLYFGQKLVGNKEEAEEITDDAFVKLYERIDNFSLEVNVKAFLYITVRNACFNKLRQNKTHNVNKKGLAYLSQEDFERSAEQLLIEAEVWHYVIIGIEKLPPTCKAIFKLKYVERMSIDEIATKLGKDKKNIYTQLSLGYKRLRELFNNPS